VPLPEILTRQGIVPGIKVDGGTRPLPGSAGEKITQGLDGLAGRLTAFRALGARFTKWRAVIAIGANLPTAAGVEANARALALFASLSQQAGLVPIVEPEVLMDGDHPLARCEEVTGAVLQTVFAALREQRVALETMLLKTGMVLSGHDCGQQAATAEIAAATLRCLRAAVPAAVPGIVFLSGGQAAVPATERLNAICAAPGLPWRLSFSYGRALQDPAMKIWRGSPDQRAAAQAALFHRARCNGRAVLGGYSPDVEREAGGGFSAP
jgi:fructose-bisphosphate aldolase class I